MPVLTSEPLCWYQHDFGAYGVVTFFRHPMMPSVAPLYERIGVGRPERACHVGDLHLSMGRCRPLCRAKDPRLRRPSGGLRSIKKSTPWKRRRVQLVNLGRTAERRPGAATVKVESFVWQLAPRWRGLLSFEILNPM